jgi:hypothetical protein
MTSTELPSYGLAALPKRKCRLMFRERSHTNTQKYKPPSDLIS